MASAHFPDWLHGLSIASLTLAILCVVVILVDIMRRPQKMAIVNWVWPLTGLFGSVISLFCNLKAARLGGPGMRNAIPYRGGRSNPASTRRCRALPPRASVRARQALRQPDD
ncbi:hypothetical protein LL253_01025 [Sphingobium soli]|uniref:DUF1109 domain-containing protein n=1 Tax=Sphingobium soli TaxID=1591116 RepID=A0ABS8GYB3_9SPHN|nr:hypothetical protein [Sphingobium soli]MCC4231267.1 hypothetical protein [Sphingobium soli]